MDNIYPEFSFYPGETKTLVFELPVELAVNKDTVDVLFYQDYTQVRDTKTTDVSVTGKMLQVALSSNDTDSFLTGYCDVQIKYKLADGTVRITDPVTGYVGQFF